MIISSLGNYVPYHVPYHGNYIMCPEVKELEDRLAAYVGAKHAIGCASGTDAFRYSNYGLN